LLTVIGNANLAGGDHVAATPDGNGYWMVTPTGAITTYGDAVNYGSMAGKPLNKPIVGYRQHAGRQGLLARGIRRRDLQLRRRCLPRLHGRHAA